MGATSVGHLGFFELYSVRNFAQLCSYRFRKIKRAVRISTALIFYQPLSNSGSVGSGVGSFGSGDGSVGSGDGSDGSGVELVVFGVG
ncbi:hypothetical protein DL239_14985 [Sedimentitalea sp. CY04]|uniref:Uncharacterized protein n=1 Tax=Parasedimentitalea denitrificans TaxID=2211118 RepID=A0ABX0WBN7_9RHOB|nr:hypothetical protein [Sedimentitalea sp. CY04]